MSDRKTLALEPADTSRLANLCGQFDQHLKQVESRLGVEIFCRGNLFTFKGEARPVVVPCTLLPYDARFEMGQSLAEAAGAVSLNHPHCARFCVLGGGSCGAV